MVEQDAASDSVHVSVPGTAGRMLEAHHLTYPVREFRSGGRAGRLLWQFLGGLEHGRSVVLCYKHQPGRIMVSRDHG